MKTRDRLRALLKERKDLSLTEMGERLGVSRQRIAQLLRDEGLTKRTRHQVTRA